MKERRHTNPVEPLANVLGHELRPCRSEMCAGVQCATMRSIKAVQHVVGLELACHDDSEASSCELVDHGQHVKAPPVRGAALHEVVGPHLMGSFRSQPNA
jgi:hypothetical protein